MMQSGGWNRVVVRNNSAPPTPVQMSYQYQYQVNESVNSNDDARRMYYEGRPRSRRWICDAFPCKQVCCAYAAALILLAVIALIICLVFFLGGGVGSNGISSNSTASGSTPSGGGDVTAVSGGDPGATNPDGMTDVPLASKASGVAGATTEPGAAASQDPTAVSNNQADVTAKGESGAPVDPTAVVASTVKFTGSPATLGTGVTTAGAQVSGNTAVTVRAGSGASEAPVDPTAVTKAAGVTDSGGSPGQNMVTTKAAASGATVGSAAAGSSTAKPTGTGVTAGAGMTTVSSGTKGPLPTCPSSEPVLIHQKLDVSTFFDRTLAEMKGQLGTKAGNYWYGLEDIHTLTQSGKYKLLVDFVSFGTGVRYVVQYATFTVGDEASGYQLTIGGFGGNFTYDAFKDYSGYKFSTKDSDNDNSASNCAVTSKGAWWYDDCDCKACLTQAEDVNFKWEYAFETTPLETAKMYLVCK